MKYAKGFFVLALCLLTIDGFSQRGRRGRGGPYGPGHGPGNGRHSAGMVERLVIPLGGQIYRGQNVLPLKRLLKSQYPRLNLQNADLVRVRLVAKTRAGRGTAQLIVGPRGAGYPQSVGMGYGDFHSNHGQSYEKVMLRTPRFSGPGRWQVELNGFFKVKRVVVMIKSSQLTLRLGGQHYTGFNVIGIKRLIKQQYPDIVVQSLGIKSIELIAKSRHGQGQATLISGGMASRPVIIDGYPGGFHRGGSYHSVFFKVPYRAGGRLQLELQGNIKVKQVIVNLM